MQWGYGRDKIREEENELVSWSEEDIHVVSLSIDENMKTKQL